LVLLIALIFFQTTTTERPFGCLKQILILLGEKSKNNHQTLSDKGTYL